MSDVTRILDGAAAGDRHAAAELLPLVYDELRRLAAARMAEEKPGQTLQTTALVHEAYVRLVDGAPERPWNSRGHFFAAAAEAMRRILVENARRKNAPKHGGGWNRVDVGAVLSGGDEHVGHVLEFDEVLTRLGAIDPVAARLVELRAFAGLTMEQSAAVLALPLRTVERNWAFARTWLHRELVAKSPADS